MKTKTNTLTIIFLALSSLLLSTQTHAQVVLWGLTDGGGINGVGTIYSITPSGNFTTYCDLNPTYAALPAGSLLYASDGNFYATSVDGGYADSCTVFRYAHSGTLYTMINLDSVWGSSAPEGNSLIQGMDGNLYGMTTYGGKTSNSGVLFKLQLNGHYTALHFFDTTDGAGPHGSLIQTADSMLWGMTSVGGMNSGNIFHCTPSGIFTSVFNFDSLDGINPYGDLLLASDSNFYGLTSNGGLYGYGTLFRYSHSGRFTKLVDFNDTNGAYPFGSLIEATNGKLYGLTSAGGDSNNDGTLFVCTLSGNLTTLVTFNYDSGTNPYGTLIQASDGYLYGTTSYGGINNNGTIFQCSLTGSFKTISNFGNFFSPVHIYGKLIEEDTAHFAFDTLQSLDSIPQSISKILNSNNLRVYPNPSNGIFTIQLSGISGQSSVEIYNVLGEKVYSSALPQTPKGVLSEINLSNQPEGIYLYSVISENGKLLGEGKLVIQK